MEHQLESADSLFSEAQALAWESFRIWVYLFCFAVLRTVIGAIWLIFFFILVFIFLPKENPTALVLTLQTGLEGAPILYGILFFFVFAFLLFIGMFFSVTCMNACIWSMGCKIQNRHTTFFEGLRKGARPVLQILGAQPHAFAYSIVKGFRYLLRNKQHLQPSEIFQIVLVFENVSTKDALDTALQLIIQADKTYSSFSATQLRRSAMGCVVFIIMGFGLLSVAGAPNIYIGALLFWGVCALGSLYNASQRLLILGVGTKLYMRFKDAPSVQTIP